MKQTLPQNGLQVGNQINTDGDNVALGRNVGIQNDLRVGNTVYANRIATPFVTNEHVYSDRNLTIDCSYQSHNVIMKANATGIAFTNVPPAVDGAFQVIVYINQDVVGNRVLNFSAITNVRFPNTGASTANPVYPALQTLPYRVDVFKFITFDGGLNWIGYQDNPIIPPSFETLTLHTQSPTVVQKKYFTVMPTAHVSTATTTPVDFSLTASITPKYVNSRIEVEFFSTMSYGAAASSQLGTMLFRDINGGGYTNLTPKSGGSSRYTYGWSYKDSAWSDMTLRYFDTPATLLPVTYKLQYFNHAGTGTNYLVHQYMECGWVLTEITNWT
jgi:hypothetical protein